MSGKNCMIRAASMIVTLALGLQAASEAAAQQTATRGQTVESYAGRSLLAVPKAEDGSNGEQAAPMPGGEDLIYGITKKQEKDITDRAYPLMSAKWPFNIVFVCWEENDSKFQHERELVWRAIHDTWEAKSALKFAGYDEQAKSWGFCKAGSVGVRIHIEDTGPYVKTLGKFVSGVRNGMVLNFTYRNWSPSCQDTLDYCDKAIAVHEFGHAIGFAHEQNRPDTPGECRQTDAPQGGNGDTLLTPWDIHSVMNYCNPIYANNGDLSEFDIKAVQYIYGAPK